jgi:hypothetical protein
VAITNFDNEMIGLYHSASAGSGSAGSPGAGTYDDIAMASGLGAASRSTLGFGCAFFDANLDGWLDLAVANGHIDETVRNIRGNVGYAQAPQLFLNQGTGKFRDIAREVGGGFETPIVGRGLAYGDFDRDGDLDLLLTTNNGPAYLYRNDQTGGNRSIQFQLTGTKSNRDAIGATVRISLGRLSQMRVVRGGSSYLSQSELPVTFGVGRSARIERVTVDWPSGRNEEYKDLATGKSYEIIENTGVKK